MRIVVKNTLLTNGSISASGHSGAVQKAWAEQAIAHIKARGKTGTPTVVFKIQSSPDQIVWDNLDDSATLTAAGQDVVKETNFGRWIRVAWTHSGNGSLTGVDIILQCKGD